MFIKNIPCRLITEADPRNQSLNSIYEIYANRVVRHKRIMSQVYDQFGKNIFYVNPKDFDDFLDKEEDLGYRIGLVEQQDQVIIYFLDTSSYILSRIPKLGYHPIDMMLKNDGSCMYNGEYHIGHRIIEIKNLSNRFNINYV